ESWGDARAWDGTYSVIQPMIAPLRHGRSAIEVLESALAHVAKRADGPQPAQARVRKTFESLGGNQKAWRETVRDGLWAGSAWPVESVGTPEGLPDASYPEEGLEVVFHEDNSIRDGRWANNSWLQELPDPLTKLTWGNAALIAPATAAELGVKNETLVTIKLGGRQIELPAYVMPGQAPGSIGLVLGYGRTAAGPVGGDGQQGVEPVGVDVYPLRTSAAMWIALGATVTPTGKPYRLAGTQDHFAIDTVGQKGTQKRLGHLIHQTTFKHLRKHPDALHHAEHHPPLVSLWEHHQFDGHRWAMAIDLSKCTGCGACMIACQAENNVPVVGRDQVLVGREMHWLRVDRYFQGEPDDPEVVLQPLPCQQCELAPCEQVCPVAATTHTKEGLNDMVYNRCVGTRYCANNCPYKVRRFNFFNLHKDLENPANEIAKMKYNPQVTVRCRGVMEKCTYCVQRIQAAKIESKRTGRPIEDGAIRPACQQVCPAGAIVFGDLSDKKSQVLAQHGSNRSYALLAELNIHPRTAYLARVKNPNPELA
ncbi:MAG: 4Fe-4S dicluster domain-containing protein, partial [Pirellulales bacterium]|nr:4Fe-4S dicluster domain-containing protein [Pirellulales bacterium]